MAVARIDWAGRPVDIHHQWLGNPHSDDVWVFLHEGLGSVSMWRDFPAQWCAALGHRGLMYDRPGYGASTPRAPDERWGVDFLHRQALEVLPALWQSLGLPAHTRLHLLGHSDGGSIALIAAALQPLPVERTVVLAPHVMVEPISLHSIALAREAYVSGDLRRRLAPHHTDPDSAF